jgi:hypothetical protein
MPSANTNGETSYSVLARTLNVAIGTWRDKSTPISARHIFLSCDDTLRYSFQFSVLVVPQCQVRLETRFGVFSMVTTQLKN